MWMGVVLGLNSMPITSGEVAVACVAGGFCLFA